MNAQLDIWILLFVAAAAQGFFLFFLLLANQKKKRNHNDYLAALIFFFTITISYYITFWTNVNSSLPGFLFVILYFTFLFGPLLIGYISKVKNGRLPKAWLWHFAPFVVISLSFLFAYSSIANLSQSQILLVRRISVNVQILHLFIYSVLALILSRKGKSSRWATQVSLAFSGYALCFLIYYILVWTQSLPVKSDYIVSLGMTIFIYFLGYHGFKSPDPTSKKSFALKYEKSSLTDQAMKALEKKIDAIMMSEKLFTKGDLKLQDLSLTMEISANDISQVINVRKGMKFTDYLNELRINEAEELMRSEEHRDDKLLALAIDSGFNNKTSFLNAFKKKHGMSPSEYRKQIHLRAS